MTKLTSTAKIELQPLGDPKETLKALTSLMRSCSKAANRAVSTLFGIYSMTEHLHNNKVFGETEGRLVVEKFYKNNKLNEVTVPTVVYRVISDEFPELPSFTKAALSAQVSKLFKDDYFDIKNGNKSPRTYKSEIPIPLNWGKKDGPTMDFRLNTLRLDKVAEGWFFNFMDHRFQLIFGSTQKKVYHNPYVAVMDRLHNKEYTICDSAIDIRKGKIYLLLTYKFSSNAVQLDPETAMGVDLGITVPVALALSNNKYYQRTISGTMNGERDMFDHRLYMQKQFRNLYRELRMAKGGAGRAEKLKGLERLKRKEKAFVKTIIHRIAFSVVNEAVRNKAATIKMEFLEGYGREDPGGATNKLLRNWGYYQIQQRIKEKAEKNGINVVFIDPYHTSQTCSNCGHYEPGQRSKDKRSIFVCRNEACELHGKEQHADINAARNISRGREVQRIQDCEFYKNRHQAEEAL